MAINMGFYGQDEWNGYPNIKFKQKNRWKFVIPSISSSGVGSLPPMKTSRPNIGFKEMTAEHLNETISFPSKPEFKPITLTLFDIPKGTENPVLTWFRRGYDPKNCSYWQPCLSAGLKCAEARLILYDGCGCAIETWVFEHVWPGSIEFFEGDMSSGDIVYCDVTLKYDRAYIADSAASLSFDTSLPSYTCSSVPLASMTNLGFAAVPNIVPVPEAEFIVIR